LVQQPGLSTDDHETTTTIQYYTELGQPRTDEHGAPVPPDMLKRLSQALAKVRRHVGVLSITSAR
jgi:hypothetical protein